MPLLADKEVSAVDLFPGSDRTIIVPGVPHVRTLREAYKANPIHEASDHDIFKGISPYLSMLTAENHKVQGIIEYTASAA